MGGGQSKEVVTEKENIKTKVAARDNLVSQLQKKVETLDGALQNSRQTGVELSEQVVSLQTQLREAQEAQDAAIEQKKEWQMQAASIHAKMEKYRDRYELMLEKFKDEQIKKMKKDGLSEDLATDAEKEVQEMTNTHIAQIDKLLASKEKEVMSV